MELVKRAEVILLLAAVHSCQEVRQQLAGLYFYYEFAVAQYLSIHLLLVSMNWRERNGNRAYYASPGGACLKWSFHNYHALERGNYILFQAQNSALARANRRPHVP